MAKSTFLDFSTTAGDNTDCGGIGILGTNSVSNFDNAFRTLMAILRRDLDNGTVFATKSGAYTAVANDNNAFYEFTATATLTLTAAATLGADWHMMVFAYGGSVTIDADGTELINGAETLVVADGDAAYLICTGSAFVAVVIPASSVKASVDIGSAATTSIGAAASQNVRVTGTTTITSLGTAPAGLFRRVLFAASLTLTHNATSLILPGAANITTAADDIACFVSEGSGNWRCTSYQRTAFRANGGVVESGSNANGEYVRFADGTQICWGGDIAASATAAAGSIFRSSGTGLWTFPAAFSSIPGCSASSTDVTSTWANAGGATTTTVAVRAYSFASGTGFNIRVSAIGRWF